MNQTVINCKFSHEPFRWIPKWRRVVNTSRISTEPFCYFLLSWSTYTTCPMVIDWADLIGSMESKSLFQARKTMNSLIDSSDKFARNGSSRFPATEKASYYTYTTPELRERPLPMNQYWSTAWLLSSTTRSGYPSYLLSPSHGGTPRPHLRSSPVRIPRSGGFA